MNYKSVMVTGGAGFIGSNFLNYAVPKYKNTKFINADVLSYAGNLENLHSVEKAENYSFEHIDIRDREAVSNLFEKHSVDAVIHFAAESHVDRSILGPRDFIETNVIGTFNLLESARLYWGEHGGFADKRFHHVSTDEVYGTLGETGLFTEETNYQPNSPYSASKAGSDHLVRAYCHTYNMNVVTTNCSNNYGPFQFPEKLIPLMFANAMEGKALPVYGTGKNVRDWLHVQDHCEAIDLVFAKGKQGETYNIGGHNEMTNIDIVHLICAFTDKHHGREKSSKELITYVEDRKGHDWRYAIDASKIAKELGWTPRYTFEQGLEETLTWYLNNMTWAERVKSGAYHDYYEKNYGAR
jgi:dTDP-glucose 4,6-dehydratase